MKLLELDNMIGVPTAEASQIEEFHELIKRDRTHRKRQASKEFAYIFYLCHWDSPYAKYSEQLREEKVIQDIFEEEWTPDEDVIKAREKYKELVENEFKQMLEGAREGAYKLTQYFKTVDLDAVDEKTGKPIYSAKDLIYNLEKVGKVMEGIEKLIEMVKKNEERDKQNRAGVETTQFNE